MLLVEVLYSTGKRGGIIIRRMKHYEVTEVQNSINPFPFHIDGIQASTLTNPQKLNYMNSCKS